MCGGGAAARAHLLGGHHGVGEAVVVAPRVLLVHQVPHVKVLDLGRKLGGELGGVEAGDEVHTAHAVQQLRRGAGEGAGRRGGASRRGRRGRRALLPYSQPPEPPGSRPPPPWPPCCRRAPPRCRSRTPRPCGTASTRVSSRQPGGSRGSERWSRGAAGSGAGAPHAPLLPPQLWPVAPPLGGAHMPVMTTRFFGSVSRLAAARTATVRGRAACSGTRGRQCAWSERSAGDQGRLGGLGGRRHCASRRPGAPISASAAPAAWQPDQCRWHRCPPAAAA